MLHSILLINSLSLCVRCQHDGWVPVGITSYHNDGHLLSQSAPAQCADLRALCTADETAWRIFMGEGKEKDRCSKLHPSMSHGVSFLMCVPLITWVRASWSNSAANSGCCLEEPSDNQASSTSKDNTTCVTILPFFASIPLCIAPI